MLLGRSIIHWLFFALVAACVFFVAQWLIPILFKLIGVDFPENIVNIFALLIALGFFYAGYNWRNGTVAGP